jgi:hypothetical protein
LRATYYRKKSVNLFKKGNKDSQRIHFWRGRGFAIKMASLKRVFQSFAISLQGLPTLQSKFFEKTLEEKTYFASLFVHRLVNYSISPLT